MYPMDRRGFYRPRPYLRCTLPRIRKYYPDAIIWIDTPNPKISEMFFSLNISVNTTDFFWNVSNRAYNPYQLSSHKLVQVVYQKIEKKIIYSIFENDLASHLFSLIKYNGGEIKNCPTGNGKLTTAKQNCKYNNHIYINLTETIDSVPSEYNMGYFIENFKTGPIVFDSTKLLFTDNIFQNIPIGAILYDFDENKYIKTKYGIKVLK